MTCHDVRQKLPIYIEEPSRVRDSRALRRHLLACGDCHQEYEYMARLSSPLRELARVAPPPELAASLRRQVASASGSRIPAWQRWQVHLANLMRPVALPAAGGLIVALILFGVLIPGVSVTRVVYAHDVPTVLMTEPRVKAASVIHAYEDLPEEDLLVEAWVDERGAISRFEVLNPEPGGPSEKELRDHLNNVMFTTLFEPATEFGQPAPGRVIFSFRRSSRITIRG